MKALVLFIDYEKEIKQFMKTGHQGSVGYGILSIVVGAAILAAFIGLRIAFKSMKPDPKMIVLIIAGGVLVITGIVTLIRGINSRRVVRDGHPGQCTIIKISWLPSRYGRTYTMRVSFMTDYGYLNEHIVDLGRMDVSEFFEGMTIACTICGDECYVDRKNIRVISYPDHEVGD